MEERLPEVSTRSNALEGVDRLGVKNGRNPLLLESGFSDVSLAVKPMEPLATLRLMIVSKPTKAPLRMNSTLEVSMW